ncbi:hypothetical protein [Catenulispora pinisilvae]|uniref:hypothetical protein n=1 Tax=Catenulispora pinisilvae TaxID=2705253 RepID=UPI0018925A98|nr:hypothetical protein [Catenulispora pinisilvae]
MTKQTTYLGLPYPEPGDAPRAPDQTQALAERIDTVLGAGFWTSGEARIPARSEGTAVPLALADGAGPPQGWTLNADGTLTCKVPGLYLVGGFAYVFETGGLDFVWSYNIHQEPEGWDPLAQVLLPPDDIPNISGPVRCAQGDVLSVRVGSTSTGAMKAWATLWAMPFPVVAAPPQLTPPKHAYNLGDAGGAGG